MNLIKSYRELANLSQAELAKKLGYTSPQFVSNIERGLSEMPTKKLKLLQKVLNIPTQKLIAMKLKPVRARLEKALE